MVYLGLAWAKDGLASLESWHGWALSLELAVGWAARPNFMVMGYYVVTDGQSKGE